MIRLPRYSVVTKIPEAPFSNENPGYLLRCSTFSQTINWPLDAFYDEELLRSIYGVNIHNNIVTDIIAYNTASKNATLNNAIDGTKAINKIAGGSFITPVLTYTNLMKLPTISTTQLPAPLRTLLTTLLRLFLTPGILIHGLNVHSINIYNANEIISAADEVISKSW